MEGEGCNRGCTLYSSHSRCCKGITYMEGKGCNRGGMQMLLMNDMEGEGCNRGGMQMLLMNDMERRL